MFHGLAQASGEGLVAGPVFGVAKAMRGPLLLVDDMGVGDEGLEGFQGLGCEFRIYLGQQTTGFFSPLQLKRQRRRQTSSAV